jgi:metal-sulfur cluster biosynthetic enzyme
MSATIDDITEAMKDVIDPELGINVVDLGLVYDMRLDENNIATLDMTLTSAACPLQDVIEDQTRQVLADLTTDVKINWVWLPVFCSYSLGCSYVNALNLDVISFFDSGFIGKKSKIKTWYFKANR